MDEESIKKGQRVRIIRKELGLTLEKMGEYLGVKKSTLSNIESGRTDLTERMLKSICRELNVNEEFLRYGTGEMFSVPEDETAAIVSDLLEDADDEFYKMVLDVVHTYQQLQPDSKEVLRNFCRQLADNVKTRKD